MLGAMPLGTVLCVSAGSLMWYFRLPPFPLLPAAWQRWGPNPGAPVPCRSNAGAGRAARVDLSVRAVDPSRRGESSLNTCDFFGFRDYRGSAAHSTGPSHRADTCLLRMRGAWPGTP